MLNITWISKILFKDLKMNKNAINERKSKRPIKRINFKSSKWKELLTCNTKMLSQLKVNNKKLINIAK